jgi:hypothetical protein
MLTLCAATFSNIHVLLRLRYVQLCYVATSKTVLWPYTRSMHVMNDKEPSTTASYAKLFDSVNYSRIDVTGPYYAAVISTR